MSVVKILYRKEENGRYQKVIVPIKTKEEYLAERSAPQHVSRFHAVRNGNDDEKKNLAQFNYTLYPPSEETPLRGYKIPSDSFCLDIDCASKEESDVYAERLILAIFDYNVVLIERTAHYGLHVVCKREYGKTILESQVRLASAIDCEMDTNAKDLQRVWYASTNEEDELIFISEKLFEMDWNEEKAKEEVEILTNRSRNRMDDVPEEARKSNKHYRGPLPASPRGGEESQYDKRKEENAEMNNEELTPSLSYGHPLAFSYGPPTSSTFPVEGQGDSNADGGDSVEDHGEKSVTFNSSPRGGREGASYQGIPFSAIITKYWEMFNEGKEPSEGTRNVLTYELAMTLRPLVNFKRDDVKKIVPNYGLPVDEFERTIESACSQPVKGMPYRLRQVLKAVKEERRLRHLSESREDGSVEDSLPSRPESMPEFLDLVASKVPMKYKAMVDEAIWPAICAHVRGVKFKYIDGVEHEPNICSPLIARQSSGKGMVNMPIEMLLADITLKDKENIDRERDWRKRNQGKANSKDKQPRPDDICIQRLDDDLTPAALAQSLIDAENNGGKRVITKVDEIEMLNKVGNGRNDTVGLYVRYGFDSQRFGQRRVGLESVNGSYTVRWVWNASCTLKSARKFITQDWIGNGSLSRLNLNALMLPKDDHEMPRIGDYDDEYRDALKPYIDRINAASGLIECPQANQVAEEMVAEHSQIADLSDDEGYRTLSYRAVVIGWLKANLLYVMNGYRWEEVFGEYVKYSVRRDMWLKMYFFGKEINDEFEEEEQKVTRGPQNMLALLPDEFTKEEYFEMRRNIGKPVKYSTQLTTWQGRGLIVYDEVTRTYIKSHP
ncbi:MAG: hypothetical protein Q4E26_02400 [Prevotellaceae bacterium]|nr:hypothetical protein [Prevotellaceae bacterium]